MSSRTNYTLGFIYPAFNNKFKHFSMQLLAMRPGPTIPRLNGTFFATRTRTCTLSRMAEQVHLALESRLDELEDLIERGIFFEDEVKEIVKKRKKYLNNSV